MPYILRELGLEGVAEVEAYTPLSNATPDSPGAWVRQYPTTERTITRKGDESVILAYRHRGVELGVGMECVKRVMDVRSAVQEGPASNAHMIPPLPSSPLPLASEIDSAVADKQPAPPVPMSPGASPNAVISRRPSLEVFLSSVTSPDQTEPNPTPKAESTQIRTRPSDSEGVVVCVKLRRPHKLRCHRDSSVTQMQKMRRSRASIKHYEQKIRKSLVLLHELIKSTKRLEVRFAAIFP